MAGFTFESVPSCSFSPYRVNFIGFLFSRLLDATELPRKLYLSSGTASDNPAGEGMRFLDTISWYDHYKELLLTYHLPTNTEGPADDPSLWQGELLVGEYLFSGEIRHWSQPYKLSLFSLRGQEKDTSLEGNACGLPFEELLDILKKLEIINERIDVLRQYQNERRD